MRVGMCFSKNKKSCECYKCKIKERERTIKEVDSFLRDVLGGDFYSVKYDNSNPDSFYSHLEITTTSQIPKQVKDIIDKEIRGITQNHYISFCDFETIKKNERETYISEIIKQRTQEIAIEEIKRMYN